MPDVEGEEAPLGERPAADELALNVAQARIASKLFGSTGEVTVGRYKLLELVGRGGMGVVWGAWDPELERRIAIKLVDHLRPDARDRIVTEARALAKLSHPHVVPVHDVGVVDDRVYLVMEWVAGETLRAYKPRSERDIVDIYTQAARGLGAIHAAGFVHRDFKPDNAMIGGDHRVRVLDLGLARGDLDDNARREVAGTPRYMAPEQAAGATPTPAVDQFALCVSLREALEVRGAVPRWLAAIIARGTAAKPEDRFASMDEVVRALGRDPARVWRRRIIVGVALAATATAFVVGRAAKDDPCSTTRANVLSPEVRARIASHLDGLGAFAQGERDALLALLDDRERGLQRMHRQACVAHDRGDLTTAFYERRLTCLARAESSLGAVAEILEGVTAARFPDARVAAGALVDPAHCTRVDQSLVPLPDVSALSAVRKTEAAVERARLLATAARPDAIDAATNARMAAEKIGYLPLVARAFLVEGRAELLAEKMVQASTTLETSMRSGFAAHDDAVAVEAFARMVFAASRGGKTVDGANVIDAVAARLGPDGTFARLLLLNNLAAARMSTSDDVAAAAPLLETAMRDWRPGESENDYELVSIPQNLALAISDPARSVELLASARSAAVSMLGERHPRVLEIDRMHALFVDLPAARTLYDRSCAQLAELFPELVARRAECEYQAGWLADEAGDRDAALAHFRAAPLDPKSRRAQIAAAMIALDRTNAKQIATELERDAETDAKAQFLFTRAVAADAYIAAARGWHEHGDRVAELRCWDGARRLLEAIKRPAFARRLARVRAALEK